MLVFFQMWRKTKKVVLDNDWVYILLYRGTQRSSKNDKLCLSLTIHCWETKEDLCTVLVYLNKWNMGFRYTIMSRYSTSCIIRNEALVLHEFIMSFMDSLQSSSHRCGAGEPPHCLRTNSASGAGLQKPRYLQQPPPGKRVSSLLACTYHMSAKLHPKLFMFFCCQSAQIHSEGVNSLSNAGVCIKSAWREPLLSTEACKAHSPVSLFWKSNTGKDQRGSALISSPVLVQEYHIILQSWCFQQQWSLPFCGFTTTATSHCLK